MATVLHGFLHVKSFFLLRCSPLFFKLFGEIASDDYWLQHAGHIIVDAYCVFAKLVMAI